MNGTALEPPSRVSRPSWGAALRQIAPLLGGFFGFVLSLTALKGDPPVVITWGAVIGSLAIATAAVALARVAGAQGQEHDSWLRATRTALGVLLAVTVLAVACAYLVTAAVVAVPVGAAVTVGAVLVLVDGLVERSRGARPRADVLETDTREARSVVLARWTWLGLAITVGFTWIVLTAADKVLS